MKFSRRDELSPRRMLGESGNSKLRIQLIEKRRKDKSPYILRIVREVPTGIE